MSHSLIVEAIESLFGPYAIFNNKGRKDKNILDQYGEPNWNNPVIRILDEQGKDVVKKIGNDYSALTLCKRMIAALLKNKKRSTRIFNFIKTRIRSIGFVKHQRKDL